MQVRGLELIASENFTSTAVRHSVSFAVLPSSYLCTGYYRGPLHGWLPVTLPMPSAFLR